VGIVWQANKARIGRVSYEFFRIEADKKSSGLQRRMQ
jgi:hypothetical protein